MRIETYIDSLVSYAMNTGLAQPEDYELEQLRKTYTFTKDNALDIIL